MTESNAVATRDRQVDDGTPARVEQARVLSRCLELPVLGGNRVAALDAPARVADALFRAIEGAIDHVHVDCSLVGLMAHGDALTRRLLARCRAGVRIHLLLRGSGADDAETAQRLERLRRGGAKVCVADAPPRWRAVRHADTARLLVVIDGRLALVGGLNLRHASSGTDAVVRIEGPAVAELQWLFIERWERESLAPLSLVHGFPALAWVGAQRVGIAAASAGRSPLLRALVAAIGTARRCVLLTSADGVPDPTVQSALVAASGRGVEVHLGWSPGDHGAFWIWHARPQVAALARAGVRTHELTDQARHAHSSVIDGVWSCIGSSLSRHALSEQGDMNVIVVDAEFGARIEAVFRHNLARASPSPARAPGRARIGVPLSREAGAGR